MLGFRKKLEIHQPIQGQFDVSGPPPGQKVGEKEGSEHAGFESSPEILSNTIKCNMCMQVACTTMGPDTVWFHTETFVYSETSLVPHSTGCEEHVRLGGCWIAQ